MSPANLNDPFGPSCCDGGACSTAESAQPCGCDMGCKPKPHYCEQHRPKRHPKWKPREGYCCVIGCWNAINKHNAYCDECWDLIENND